jgi:hypothetical protein
MIAQIADFHDALNIFLSMKFVKLTTAEGIADLIFNVYLESKSSPNTSDSFDKI